jgi:hypothetical protein
MLTTHFHLALNLKMSEDIISTPSTNLHGLDRNKLTRFTVTFYYYYYYYYLAGCTMFPHLPAPISQLCNLPPPIVSISPIFFL